ncbi:UNVERIFIED_CONTAM: hypothetical protein ABID98_000388 [Brevibacillus sp. OAP136]
MSDKTDQELLQKLRELPGFSLDKEKKQQILENVMQEEKRYMRQTRTRGSFSLLGKGIAVCALVGAVWVGASVMKHQDQQVAQSPLPDSVTGKQPDPTLATTPSPMPTQNQVPPAQSDPAAPIATAERDGSLLKQLFELSRQGQVEKGGISVENSVIDTYEKQWGKPDATRFEDGLSYYTYNKKGLDIGFNKGMQVVEIRYHTPAITKLTMKQTKQALGLPHSIHTTINDQTVFVYKPNDKYLFEVVFPAATKQQPDPAIQYVVVRYPQGAINLMAQRAPDELLGELKTNAAKGQLLQVPVTVGKSMIDELQREWGKPSRQDFVNGLLYSVFPDKSVVLASNKGDQIVEIRSYDYQLRQITKSQALKTLGKPTETVKIGDQQIEVYQVSPDYQLKVVFPLPTQEIPDPTIDHVNVLYPRGTVNQMAQ